MNRTRIFRRTFGTALLFLPALILVDGCSLADLKRDVAAGSEIGAYVVDAGEMSSDALTRIVVYSAMDSDPQIVVKGAIDRSGKGLLVVPDLDLHRILVYRDANADGRWNPGEAGVLSDPIQAVALTRADVLKEGGVLLEPGLPFELDPGYPAGDLDPESETGVALPFSWGEIADLKNERFSEEAGRDGYWRPYEFLITTGAGVFFLEPYDPDRIPVLYVHGAAGTPANFEALISDLDRDRYQPWVFLYPSGFRLERIARALAMSLRVLNAQYHPERIVMVAHSMGGLVAFRSLQLVGGKDQRSGVRTLITLSTPWSGHEGVEGGLKHLDTPVPSWIDMAPDSDFIRSVLEDPVPAGLRHHLVFGYGSSMRIGLDRDNDGTVALESELDPRAQRRAVSVFGLQAGHVEILGASATFDLVRRYLAGDEN